MAAGLTDVGLLATGFTMEHDFYRDRLAGHGLRVLVPDADDRAEVHPIIYDELCLGVVCEESRQTYVGAAPCPGPLAVGPGFVHRDGEQAWTAGGPASRPAGSQPEEAAALISEAWGDRAWGLLLWHGAGPPWERSIPEPQP